MPELGEILETGAGSIRRWNALNQGLSRCGTISLQQGGKTINGSVGALSFPKVDDQSSAYALTLSVEGVSVGFDIILFRVGSYVGELAYAAIGSPDISVVQGFSTQAINKINGQPTTAGSAA